MSELPCDTTTSTTISSFIQEREYKTIKSDDGTIVDLEPQEVITYMIVNLEGKSFKIKIDRNVFDRIRNSSFYD